MSRDQAWKRSSGLGRALAVVPLAALTLWGCGTIIGLDNYTVESGGTGGASQGGSAGTVGEAGEAAGGISGASTGGSSTGGTAPIAGTTSAAGTGAVGEGGAPPAPTNLGCDGKTTFTPNDNLVRSCILRAGCSINPVPVRTISECVTKNTQAALPGESCNLASKTCDDFDACDHTGIAHDDLCGGSLATRCTASGLAVNCGNSDLDYFYDCKAQGLTCGTYSYTFSDNTTALFADCVVPAPAGACDGIDDDMSYFCQPGSSTVPDAYYYCYDGQAFGQSCSKLANCYDTTPAGGEPAASCFFNFDAQCTGQPDSATCTKGVDKECSSESIISYDCTSTPGLGCATKGTVGYCLAPGCKPADVDACAESCGADGTTLTFCYGGVPFPVDCTAYGFSTCEPGTTTNSDGTKTAYANCR